jgi:hypothetical protein
MMKINIEMGKEEKTTRVEIPLEIRGGNKGVIAVKNLIALINGFKSKKTEEEIEQHIYVVFGYCLCCRQLGFLSEQGADDLMEIVEYLQNVEKDRIKQQGE